MSYDFSHHMCRAETRRVIWVITLVLASVLTIQYFELPYKSSILSLLSFGNIYSKLPHGEISSGDVGLINNPTPLFSAEKSLPVSSIDRKNRTISPVSSVKGELSYVAPSPLTSPFSEAPVKSVDALLKENVAQDIISPSVPVRDDIIASRENATIITSTPSFNIIPLAPAVSPSQSLSSINTSISINTSNGSKNSEPTRNDQASLDMKQTKNNTDHAKPDRVSSIISLSEMNDMLVQSRVSSFSKSPLWASPADQELQNARFLIENGDTVTKDPGLYAPIYRNLTRFLRSYELMEQKLKIYVYKDGKRPIFHQPRLKGIYASEGWFMKLLEASNKYLTKAPMEAHLFYLPYSSQLLVDYVYVKDSHTFNDINRFLKNYLDGIKMRYTFWNRTDGADHFLVACHDWAPVETRKLMTNTIRAMCNSDVKEGFQLGKDVSLPETCVHSPQNPMKDIGGNPPSQRKILAFFAGQMHGYVRPILLKQWQNKDAVMKIFGKMKKGYQWHMKNSKYCICAKGYEVNSPRVVEAILYGCVPVIISDNFVPPFFEILKWDSVAVFVQEKDIPDLKKILVSIPDETYRTMQKRVENVRCIFFGITSR